MLYKGSGMRNRVGVGLGLFAILIKEVRENLTEKGLPEKKTSRREGRELLRLIRKSVPNRGKARAKALRQEYAWCAEGRTRPVCLQQSRQAREGEMS